MSKELISRNIFSVRVNSLYNNSIFPSLTVECWNWLLSARPDLELVFLQEMISAWHSTQHLKLGLFSDSEPQWCPLAPDEKSKYEMKPFKPENIEAHDLWIKFIQERIEIAKYCSQEQIFMFSHMLQRTLDIGNC